MEGRSLFIQGALLRSCRRRDAAEAADAPAPDDLRRRRVGSRQRDDRLALRRLCDARRPARSDSPEDRRHEGAARTARPAGDAVWHRRLFNRPRQRHWQLLLPMLLSRIAPRVVPGGDCKLADPMCEAVSTLPLTRRSAVEACKLITEPLFVTEPVPLKTCPAQN